jgi:hypothetical protein
MIKFMIANKAAKFKMASQKLHGSLFSQVEIIKKENKGLIIIEIKSKSYLIIIILLIIIYKIIPITIICENINRGRVLRFFLSRITFLCIERRG